MKPSIAIRRRFAAFAVAGVLALAAGQAVAAGTCTDCHGMPPIDAPYRNITTGGFRGSHQTHQASAVSASTCAICHTGSATYTTGHSTGQIGLASNINTSPVAATYSKGVFFNQTSVPVMGTCSNVNCHFEKVTPAWASAKLVSPTNCNACHAAPPADGNHPSTTGAGAKHGSYYGTATTSCVKCHPDHTASANPFAHASSAGNRGLLVQFTAAPNKAGTYSRSLAYPGYLPSQNPVRNGTCTNTYCHSPGTSSTSPYPAPAVVATWGATFTSACGSCHVDMATAATPTGSHKVHSQAATANLACAICHSGAGSASTALHVNGTTNVVFSGTAAGTVYSKGTAVTPGTAAGTCSTSACHGSGTVTWGGTLFSTTVQCEKCHGSAATNPFYSTAAPTKVTANTDTRVGAHTNHLFSSTVHLKVMSNIACTNCHTVPATVGAAGHYDTYPSATLTFGALAKTGGLVPAYNATTRQCTNVYCHGASLSAATTANRTPTWNTPIFNGVATNDCGKCHGYPPATATHSGKTPTTCVSCHSHVNATGTGFTDITKHINGTVEASGGHAVPYYTHKTASATSCTNSAGGCHPNASNTAAYPTTAGVAPDCRACHVTNNPLTTANCASCHGSATATTANAKGRPNGSVWPNIAGQHNKSDHNVACSQCHGTYGTGRTDGTHGPGNRTASTVSTRATKVNVTLTTWNPTTRTCGTACGYNHGTKVWY